METSDSECFESADEDFDVKDKNILESAPEKHSTNRPKEDKKVTLLNSTLSTKVEEKRRQHEIRRNERTVTLSKSDDEEAPKLPVITDEKDNGAKDQQKENKEVTSSNSTISTKLEDKRKQTERTVTSSKSDVEEAPKLPTVTNFGVQDEKDDEGAWGWEEDDWEPVAQSNVKEDSKKPVPEIGDPRKVENDSSWSVWGGWNVSNLLTTASTGVSTLTSHVSTVLESGIGVPDPAELARMHKLQEANEPVEESNSAFNLGNLMSGVSQITKLVETTGNKVISGGLDTLETIGKKTMQVLQDGDPGLKKKRAFFHLESDQTVLSQVLREAKETTENKNKILEESDFLKRPNYERFFDDCQGLVHLEALEMLSKQCTIKIQSVLESLTNEDLISMQETLKQIEELCELTEEEEDKVLSSQEFEDSLNGIMVEVNIPLTFKKLTSTWNEAEEWLEELQLAVCNERELYIESIKILAQITALAVENFHKIAELILIKEHRSTVDEADNLVQLTTLLTLLIRNISRKLSDKLNEKGAHLSNADDVKDFMTNIFYEAENSSSYIKNSFQLLLPIIQVGVL